MTTRHAVPKDFFTEDSGWAHIVNEHGLNADQVVETDHTDDEWAWVFDTEEA